MKFSARSSSPLALTIVIALAGCGRHHGNGSQLSGEKPTPTVIALGGFNSCAVDEPIERQSMYVNSQRLRDQMAKETSKEVHTIVGCYAKDPNEVTLFSNHILENVKVPRSQVAGFLQTWVNSEKDTFAIMSGHSYGGWLSMAIGDAWDQDMAPLLNIATIDAVSPTNCKPEDFIASLFGNALPGCTQAPTDMTDISKTLKNKTTAKRWTNYYQTQADHLHSGAFAGAKENIEVSIEGENGTAWSAHAAIDENLEVWQRIITQSLMDVRKLYP